MESQALSRRGMLLGMAGLVGAVGAGTLLKYPAIANAASDKDGTPVTSEEALAYLRAGNRRWRNGDIQQRDYTPSGKSLVNGQWPIAGIVSCADSRVNPENVFDIARGNLFNVRNAGNVAGDITIGSLEYAVAVLGIPLIVVLGHTSCGAVKATQESVSTGKMPGGDIDAIVNAIAPAIRALPAKHTLTQAISANAQQTTRELISGSEIIDSAVRAKKLLIREGVYDIATKRVTLLPV